MARLTKGTWRLQRPWPPCTRKPGCSCSFVLFIGSSWPVVIVRPVPVKSPQQRALCAGCPFVQPRGAMCQRTESQDRPPWIVDRVDRGRAILKGLWPFRV